SVEEKIVNLEKDNFYDGGTVNVDGAIIKCWKAGGHGDQTYLQILQNSCNILVYTGTFLIKRNFITL
ncbi:MAG: hypothetical protein J6A17_01080, partial [Bacilli bacterium]|nr:hypothetical protein [Bacilli bacterium]